MPSNTRFNDRRPPSSITLSSIGSRQPVFRPPSHYAAAGGLTSATTTNAQPYYDSAIQHAYANSGALSYPTQPPSPESPSSEMEHAAASSTFSRLISRSPSRSSSISLSHTRSSSKSTKHEKEKEKDRETKERRKSHLNDIPMLETQLLPSLRDTIDRMTHPPTPNLQPERDTNLLPSARSPLINKVSLSYAERSPMRSPGQAYLSPLPVTTYVSARTSPRAPSPSMQPTTPKIFSPMSQNIASPNGSARHTPKALNTPKPALRSALRTPIIAAAPAVITPSSAASSPAGTRSLRSAKNSGNPYIRSDANQSSPRETSSHARSRTGETNGNLSSLPASTLPPRAQTKPIPTPHTPAARKSTHTQGPSSLPRSSLPRPKFSSASATASDSMSDLERTYGRTLAAGRLVVANALIVPSSSESEMSDREDVHSRDNTRRQARPRGSGEKAVTAIPVPSARKQARAYAAPTRRYEPEKTKPVDKKPVGLGLRFGIGVSTGPNTLLNEESYDAHMSNDHAHDHGRAVSANAYGKDTNPRQKERSGMAEHQSYGNEERESRTRQKRREALLGIVHGLELDFGMGSSEGRGVLSQSESEGIYNAEVMAISGSSEFPDDGIDQDATVPGMSYKNQERVGSEKRRSTYSDDEPTRNERRNRFDDVAPEKRTRRQSTSGRQSRERPQPRPTRGSENERSHRTSSLPRTSRNGSEEVAEPHIPRTPHAKTSRRSRDMSNTPVSSRETKVRHRVSASIGAVKERRQSVVDSVSPRIPSNNFDRTHSQQMNGDHASRQRDEVDQRRKSGHTPSNNVGTSRRVSHDWGRIVHDDSPQQSDSELPPMGRLSRAESDISSVDGGRWQEQVEVEDFSQGAAALFEKLSVGDIRPGSRNGERSYSRPRTTSRASILTEAPESNQGQQRDVNRESQFTMLSASSSAPSVYEEQPSWQEQQPEPILLTGLRCIIRASAYDTLLMQHGADEMRRQELIYELVSSEEAFASRLHTMVGIFILPLRVKDSHQWLPGVPEAITRLFDWMEDIVNLHAGLANILTSVASAWKSGTIVERIAETIKSFVPRLEVYQPYLIRVEQVRELVAHCTENSNDQFGEFVRMREKDKECGGQSLRSFLEEPIRRVTAYPQYFERLLECTPKSHTDHLPVFSLLHSTNMILGVLHAVKEREAQYDFMKDLTSRIKGLHPAVQLARRERRLLHQGLIYRIDTRNHSSQSLVEESSSPYTRQYELPATELQHGTRTPSGNHDWDARRVRSASVHSLGPSNVSHDTVAPATSIPGAQELNSRSQTEERTITALNAFVFTDLVVLVKPVRRKEGRPPYEEGKEKWRLVEDVGLSRILNINKRHDVAGCKDLLTLDLLPMKRDEIETGVIPEQTSVVSVFLSCDMPHTKPSTDNPLALAKWVEALSRCHRFTLRSLSFPSHSGAYLAHGTNVDLELDTRQSVMSILASGLPLPKSPSVQIEEISLGQVADVLQQEREERGWWSLRFQQVLREMQRQDLHQLTNANHDTN